ncbi:MAG: hypothetical protein EXR73_14970 [Myxococcales bacterium]|nr:hypothetical protein [Myxococcales bacterium]
MPIRQRLGRAAAVLAIALACGCSSPTVRVTSTYREQTKNELRALFIIVGDEQKIDPERVNPDHKDPLAVVRKLKPGDFEALIQFVPYLDAGETLWWEVVDQQPDAKESRVELDVDPKTHRCEDPLVVTVDNNLLKQDPELSILVIAQFLAGGQENVEYRLLSKARVADKETFAFDVQGKKLQEMR